MKDTARAAARLGVTQVNGFTGSAIWHQLYSFPPNDFAEVERGYEEFAERWGPIVDVFDGEGVRFGLEVHPTEIAYDFVTTRKTLDAIGCRDGFGINLDPSHFAHQFPCPAALPPLRAHAARRHAVLVHPDQLRVELQRRAALLVGAEPPALDASERNVHVGARRLPVDPHDAGLDLPGEASGRDEAGGED